MKIIGGLREMEARLLERPQTMGQIQRYNKVLEAHPEAIVVECRDENTGHRFGDASKRRGQCEKLGGAHACATLKNHIPYQAWATWAKADLNGGR